MDPCRSGPARKTNHALGNALRQPYPELFSKDKGRTAAKGLRLQDRRTTGLQDHGTTGPRDRRTAGPQDRRTAGPQDRRTTDHRTTDHRTTDHNTTAEKKLVTSG